MKCPRCQQDNPTHARFCLGCGARLALACGAYGAELPGGARFCLQCGHAVAGGTATPVHSPAPETYTPKHLAEKILTSKSALEGERKQVTVLFADLKGSMELLADRDPEEARRLLDPVLERMMEAVHRYEGTVNLLGTVVAPAGAENALRVVMHSDLKIVDPIWTTAYIVRNHGYMVYDTLFAMDAKGEIKPQMVDKSEVSGDNLTYTMTLRNGLLWHDGKPVTAEDCVASIKRWSAKDSMGQKMMGFVKELQVVNPKTFKIVLSEPTGLVLGALGKPSSNVPFMMPKRVAETDPNTQISDFTGSGPFIFKKEDWKPGDKAVYVKFDKYKPRAEAPSGLAGGKVAKVDRVEWKWIPDHQTAINALLAGEVDMLEAPPHDLYPVLKADANVRLFNSNPLGNQYTFRFNTLHKPFDNPKVRQAVFHAFNQESSSRNAGRVGLRPSSSVRSFPVTFSRLSRWPSWSPSLK
jgi:class 3 adenylate cyclase